MTSVFKGLSDPRWEQAVGGRVGVGSSDGGAAAGEAGGGSGHMEAGGSGESG